MAVGRSLLLLCLLAVLPCAYLAYAHEGIESHPQKCSKLLARKEWRTLTHIEKAEWVGAVKVCPPSFHRHLYVADAE